MTDNHFPFQMIMKTLFSQFRDKNTFDELKRLFFTHMCEFIEREIVSKNPKCIKI